jgi:hypothetical protein
MGYPDHQFHSTIFRFFLCTSLVLLLSFSFPPMEGFAVPPPTPSGLPPGDWDHVVITDQSLKSAFMPLAKHRRAQGLRSRIISTHAVARWSGQDDLMEAIRWFVATAHQEWGTRYVMLGGDAEFIPVPLGYFQSQYFSWDIPMDLYYAAPNGEWDLDGDGILGEFGDDAPDLTPVVALGRAPVSDRREAQSFVKKVIAFESVGSADNYDVLLAAEVGSPYPWQPGMEVQFDFAREMEELAEVLTDWESVGNFQRLYQNWEAWPDAAPLSPTGFLDALNADHHRFFSMMIHGIAETWSMGPDYLRPEHLEALEGMNHPLFMVPGVTQATDCRQEGVLEKLLVLPRGGCAGAMGPSATFYLVPANQFFQNFWQGMAEGTWERVGDNYRQVLVDLLEVYPQSSVALTTLQCMSIFGDPALLFLPVQGDAIFPDSKVELVLTASASPNPFNPTTEISFVLPGSPGTMFPTVVDIYDLGGRRLVRLVDDDLGPGSHSILWRGKDAAGRSVGSGLFFARIRAGDHSSVVKLILVE